MTRSFRSESEKENHEDRRPDVVSGGGARMKLIGLMACRNEDWIIGLSVRAALRWVDHLVILLHDCTDRTVEILAQIEDEVGTDRMAYRIETGEWDEMRHRQTMLECARVWGATHMAIIDADEVLTANLLNIGMVRALPPGHILQLPLYNLRHGIGQYHSNGIWSNRWVSVAFADSPELHWSGDRFHSREPEPKQLRPWRPIQQGGGGILHFWGASERRLIAKHRMYKITERLRWPHKPVAAIEYQYNQATCDTQSTCGRPPLETPVTWQFARCPPEWFAGYGLDHVDLNSVPWQEAWCDAQIAKYGRERFAGLSV